MSPQDGHGAKHENSSFSDCTSRVSELQIMMMVAVLVMVPDAINDDAAVDMYYLLCL